MEGSFVRSNNGVLSGIRAETETRLAAAAWMPRASVVCSSEYAGWPNGVHVSSSCVCNVIEQAVVDADEVQRRVTASGVAAMDSMSRIAGKQWLVSLRYQNSRKSDEWRNPERAASMRPGNCGTVFRESSWFRFGR